MAEELLKDPEEEELESDILDLSDEDFSKLPEPSEEPSVEQEGEAIVESEPEIDPEVEKEEDEETLSENPDDKQETSKEEETSGEGDVDTETDTLEGKEAEETIVENDDKKKEANDKKESSDVDYKLEYEKLMAPFKANGVDMQANNAEDAIQLMKMGAGFHKKMAALKPNMKHMKLLEKNGLLDDEKLNFLIDIHNKNPEAIAKLLKDSKLDPLDIDVEADSNYTPTNRKVTDTELALDSVLDDIRETPTFQKTLNVVSKEWDDASQKSIATEPQIISIINRHIADGTYDKVMERVTYDRSLGRLTGVSDLEAYKQAGNALADAGVLHRTEENPAHVAGVQITPKAKDLKKEIERKKKKRAASPTKGSRTTAEPAFDPLDLSDEDFAKLDINKYITAK